MNNNNNILLVHFNDLKRDLQRSMMVIADFLHLPAIEMDDPRWSDMLEQCSFGYMRENAAAFVPKGVWKSEPTTTTTIRNDDGGARTFFPSGTNGRWREVLTPAQVLRYEQVAQTKVVDPAALRWLCEGGQDLVMST